MKVLDLFSGIGGFSLGLERAGMETVAFCEIDPWCRLVLRKYWPGVQIHEDIRKLDGKAFRGVGVIAGGFPCQPHSTASRGRANAEDLWPEMRRVIRHAKPAYVVAENVPGIGLDGIDRVCSDLEGVGFVPTPLDVDTSPPGRSRGRRRFFIVAHTNSEGESRRAFNAKVACLPSVAGSAWEDYARVVGMADGLSRRLVRYRTKRLKGLGNAVVPQVVEIIGRAIMAVEDTT